ncbi:MAG: V4R domain-containing protein [Gemmatimonadales bacterium]
MATTTAVSRLAVGRAALDQLRQVLERETPDRAAGLIREIGFAAGEALYDGFVDSVSERYGVETPQGLDSRYLGEALAGYFREQGWGSVATDNAAPSVLAVDSADWAEATGRGAAVPSCHFTAGMFSDFFTRLGGYPAAIMEVECRSKGDARCRFLVGSPDTLTWIYEGLVAGSAYQSLLATIRHA